MAKAVAKAREAIESAPAEHVVGLYAFDDRILTVVGIETAERTAPSERKASLLPDSTALPRPGARRSRTGPGFRFAADGAQRFRRRIVRFARKPNRYSLPISRPEVSSIVWKIMRGLRTVDW